MLLSVMLHDERVGEISIASESIEFRLTDAYRQKYPRPILGQIFEDDPDRVHRSRVKLPPFFSNLLPEGALRELLAEQIGVKAEREPLLLVHVGDDLPGAVRVAVADASEMGGPNEVRVSIADVSDMSEPNEIDTQQADPPDAFKFSLAGVQLKLSAIRTDRGLTIPAQGRGGEWILKLPDPRYHGVPENEWAMMTLARKAGLRVADVELVNISEVAGLPVGLAPPSARALAVRRFDRAPGGRRIHIEDFAQVLDVRPSHHNKYHAANFETLARIIGRVAPDDSEEFVRRLLFNVAIGNGDAHIKNWSLIYVDPVRPALAPAYDLVSTIQYLPDDDLGLNLARSKAFTSVTMASFERLGRKAELSVDVVSVVKDMVDRIRTAWAEHRTHLPMPDEARRRMEAHWERIPVMRS